MAKKRKGAAQSRKPAAGTRTPRGGGGAEPAQQEEQPAKTPGQVAADWGKSLAAALILFLILRTFLIQTFVITSSSMEETLLVGDFLILSKAAYGPVIPFTEARLPGYTHPERGDVAVFRPPHDPDLDVVKRLVGVPGDTLMMRDKVLYLNGDRYQEPYVRHSDFESDIAHRWMRWQCGEAVALSPDISGAYRVPAGGSAGADGADGDACEPSRDNWGPVVVPDDHYFTMGDNRDDSVDSRYWGFLEGRRLRGEALIIYYSYDPERARPFPFISNMRPGRIGDVIR